MSFVTMKPIHGPECPHCGCCDAEVCGRPSRGWGGELMAKHVCGNCGHTFTAAVEDEPASDDADDQECGGGSGGGGGGGRVPATVIYHVLKCPHCGSPKNQVQRTMAPIRYHKCGSCGYNFKSVEQA